jgi:hypothetical protein
VKLSVAQVNLEQVDTRDILIKAYKEEIAELKRKLNEELAAHYNCKVCGGKGGH